MTALTPADDDNYEEVRTGASRWDNYSDLMALKQPMFKQQVVRDTFSDKTREKTRIQTYTNGCDDEYDDDDADEHLTLLQSMDDNTRLQIDNEESVYYHTKSYPMDKVHDDNYGLCSDDTRVIAKYETITSTVPIDGSTQEADQDAASTDAELSDSELSEGTRDEASTNDYRSVVNDHRNDTATVLGVDCTDSRLLQRCHLAQNDNYRAFPEYSDNNRSIFSTICRDNCDRSTECEACPVCDGERVQVACNTENSPLMFKENDMLNNDFTQEGGQHFANTHSNDNYDYLDSYCEWPIAKEKHPVCSDEFLINRDASDINSEDENGYTHLMTACLSGNELLVSELIKRKADVDYKSIKRGLTPLLCSIHADKGGEEQQYRICKHLLDSGAQSDLSDSYGASPLWLACSYSLTTIVKLLIERGASVSKADSFTYPPIVVAAQRGSCDIVELLLNQDNTLTESKTSVGYTPLIMAAQEGHSKLLRLLHKFGANVAARATDINKEMTALMIAVCNNDGDKNEDVVRTLHKLGACLDDRDKVGMTALMHATHNGDTNMVELLLTCGASINLQDKRGQTAFHWACRYTESEKIRNKLKHFEKLDHSIQDHSGKKAEDYLKENGEKGLYHSQFSHLIHCKDAKKMLNSGIDLSVVVDRYNGNTLLHYGAMLGNSTVARVLIDYEKLDNNLRKNNGRTALSLAALHGQQEVVHMLLESQDTNVNLADHQKQTALHLAAFANHVEVTKTLLKCPKVNFDASDKRGNTALHSAGSALSVETFAILLTVDSLRSQSETLTTEAPRSLDRLMRKNKEGWTPFHCVVGADKSLNKADACKKLLGNLRKPAYIAYIHKVDKQNRNLLHIAVEKNNVHIIEELNMFNPEQLNKKGLSPLHVAAKYKITTKDDIERSLLGKIISVFYSSNHCRDIDHLSSAGKSAMMICIERGFVKNAELLLEHGSHLSRRSSTGKTVLHELATCSDDQIQVELYNLIKQRAVIWYCLHDKVTGGIPPENTIHYRKLHIDAMKKLLLSLKYNGMNVLQYAAMKGAFTLLRAIVETPDLFEIEKPADKTPEPAVDDTKPIAVDVSTPTPDLFETEKPADTTTEPAADDPKPIAVDFLTPTMSKYQHCIQCIDSPSPVNICFLATNHVLQKHDPDDGSNKSVLEFIVDNNDSIGAAFTLAQKSFADIVKPYWRICQAHYVLMIVMHMVHMIVLSTAVRQRYTTKLCPSAGNELPTGVSHVDCNSSVFQSWFLFLAVWPSINFLTDLMNFLMILKHSNDTFHEIKLHGKVGDNKRPIYTIMKQWIFSFLVSLAFSVSTIIWFITIATVYLNHWHNEALALVLLIGWLYTINFLSIFKSFTIFNDVMKTIVFKDVTRIGVIFVFILLSFSLSFHTINLRRSLTADNSPSIWFTIYAVFFQTFGAESEYQEMSMQHDITDLDVVFFRVLFVLYIFISSIVLLNLLIAMMSESYNDAVESAEKSYAAKKLWMLSRVMQFERKFPSVVRAILRCRLRLKRTHLFS